MSGPRATRATTPKRKPAPRRTIKGEEREKYFDARLVYGKVAAASVAGVTFKTAKKWEDELIASGHPGFDHPEQIGPKTKASELSQDARRAREDFSYFQERYLGRVALPWQRIAAETIVRLVASPEKEYLVINCPPGSGKSTLVIHDIGAWLIARDRGIRICVLSSTMKNAVKFADQLRHTLEATTPIKAPEKLLKDKTAKDAVTTMCKDFGRFKPEESTTWTKDRFRVDRPPEEASNKENTVEAFGKDQAFLGGRYDVVICDDVYDPGQTKTLESKNDIKEWFSDVAESRLEPHGLMVLNMQRVDPEDISRYALDMLAYDVEEDPDIDAEELAAIALEKNRLGIDPLPVREGQVRKYRHIIFKAHFDGEGECKGPEFHRPGAPAYPDGCLLFPRRLTYRELMTKEKHDRGKYRIWYQQEDFEPGNVLCEWVWIKGGLDEWGQQHPGCWDNQRGAREMPPVGGDYFSFITVDPSPSQFWACVAEDSLVLTRRGEIPIQDVDTTDQVMTRRGWRPVQHCTYMGDKATLTLHLDNGRSLTVTPDHRMLTDRGWREAGSLAVGSALVVPSLRATSLTGSTHPSAPGGSVGVLDGVGVTERAMSNGHLLDDVRRPSHVGAVVLDRQVVGVDAIGNTAQVTDFNVRRNLSAVPMEQPIRKSVGKVLTRSFVDSAVSPSTTCAVPQPAAVGVDTRSALDVANVKRHSLRFGQGAVPTNNADFGAVIDDGVPTLTVSHVVSIDTGHTTRQVFDIGVYGQHEFTVEGVIVHNCEWWIYHEPTKSLFLIDLVRQRMASPEFFDYDPRTGLATGVLVDMYEASISMGGRITHVVPEVNIAQKFMWENSPLVQWLRARGVTLMPHTTTAQNKNSQEMGVQGLQSWFREGRIRLPGKQGDALLTRTRSMKLVDEATRYRLDGTSSYTDDCIMACWFATRAVGNLFRVRKPLPVRTDIPSWMRSGAPLRLVS